MIIWEAVLILWTLGLFVVSFVWKVGADDIERDLALREGVLEKYEGSLSGWATLQKVRGNALAKFWRRCERLAEVNPEMKERLELLGVELGELEEGKGVE